MSDGLESVLWEGNSEMIGFTDFMIMSDNESIDSFLYCRHLN